MSAKLDKYDAQERSINNDILHEAVSRLRKAVDTNDVGSVIAAYQYATLVDWPLLNPHDKLLSQWRKLVEDGNDIIKNQLG